MAVAGRYAYVATEGAGLRVVDVSSPTAPVEVGFCDTMRDAYGVAVAGNYAYVADGDGLRVVDVSNRSAPMRSAHTTRHTMPPAWLYPGSISTWSATMQGCTSSASQTA